MCTNFIHNKHIKDYKFIIKSYIKRKFKKNYFYIKIISFFYQNCEKGKKFHKTHKNTYQYGFF